MIPGRGVVTPGDPGFAAHTLWRIETVGAGGASPLSGNFASSSNPVTLARDGSGLFTVKAFVDANGSGNLDGTEVAKTVHVQLVQVTAITVRDAAFANVTLTNDTATATDLYIGEKDLAADGSAASIEIDADTDPAALPSPGRAMTVYRVSGDATIPADATGTLDDEPTVKLKTSGGGNRTFVVEVGFDNNKNNVLDYDEADRTINVHVVKLTIATHAIRQDDPNNSMFQQIWPESDGKVVAYGGSEGGTADDLKLIVAIEPAGLIPTYHTWDLSNPNAFENAPPVAADSDTYNAGNVAAIPGDVLVGVTVGIGGFDLRATKEIEIGVRTDDIIIVSWIDPAAVPLPPTPPPAVGADIAALFPPTGAPVGIGQAEVAGLILGQLAAGDDSPQRASDPAGLVPLNASERTYLIEWMFKYGASSDPRLAIPGNDFRDAGDLGTNENEVANFLDTETNYKLFNRLQIRYRVGTNGFNGMPTVLRHSVATGDTVDPLGLFPYIHNGQDGPAMTNSPFSGANRVSSIVDGSPDSLGIRAMNTLTAVGVANPVWWENIGNKMTFRHDGNAAGSFTMPDFAFANYPTHNIYVNGTFDRAIAQWPTPFGHFVTNPYPFGPGGRGGDGESPAAFGARAPDWTVP
jgi:hypothetical protein